MNYRIIKKYSNRRLYDTETSKYITLEEIKELVLNRISFKVIEVKSEKDMTNNVLLQIINDEENFGVPLFTTELLQNIIRFYGGITQPMLRQFLESSMAIFLEEQEKQHGKIQNILESAPYLKIISDLANKNFEFWQSALDASKTTASAKSDTPQKTRKKKKP